MADLGAEIRLTIENQAVLENLRKLGEWIDDREGGFVTEDSAEQSRRMLREIADGLQVAPTGGEPAC